MNPICIVNGQEFEFNSFKVVNVDSQTTPTKYRSCIVESQSLVTEYLIGKFSKAPVGGLFTFSNYNSAVTFSNMHQLIFASCGVFPMRTSDLILGIGSLKSSATMRLVEEYWKMKFAIRSDHPKAINETPNGTRLFRRVSLLFKIPNEIYELIFRKPVIGPMNPLKFIDFVKKHHCEIPGMVIKQ